MLFTVTDSYSFIWKIQLLATKYKVFQGYLQVVFFHLCKIIHYKSGAQSIANKNDIFKACVVVTYTHTHPPPEKRKSLYSY